MKIIDLKKHSEVNNTDGPLCLLLGNFDGVHEGHKKLAYAAVEEGRRLGIKVGVWTFEDHPMDTLSGRKNLYLTTASEKNRLFEELGLDYAVYEEFSKVKDYTPDEFVSKVLIETFDCRSVVCGFNFKFGKNGAGTPEFLKTRMAESGRDTVIVEPVCRLDMTVSSTAVRGFIEEGRMEEAEIMLGRPYSIEFPVVHGKELGRTIGLPTINQRFPEGRIRPKNGIYACTCEFDGRSYFGVANVGSRPTVNENENDVNCETHILGFEGWLYGENVKVNFYKRLRDEKKFEDVEKLKEAVNKDIADTLDYFSEK